MFSKKDISRYRRTKSFNRIKTETVNALILIMHAQSLEGVTDQDYKRQQKFRGQDVAIL